MFEILRSLVSDMTELPDDCLTLTLYTAFSFGATVIEPLPQICVRQSNPGALIRCVDKERKLPMQNQFSNAQGVSTPPVPVAKTRGQYFHFALPSGWRVQENTNGICLTSPEGTASIMAVGLVGMLQAFTPDQFLFYVLNMYQMGNARILQGQAIPPAPAAQARDSSRLCTFVTALRRAALSPVRLLSVTTSATAR